MVMEPAFDRGRTDLAVAAQLFLGDAVAVIKLHLPAERFGASPVRQDAGHPRPEIPSTIEAMIFTQHQVEPGSTSSYARMMEAPLNAVLGS